MAAWLPYRVAFFRWVCALRRSKELWPDGAALALIKHPAHLQRVYADAARGEARPKQLVRELEYWFDPTTGEVFYGIDYKAVFNNGFTTYTPGGP